MKARPDFLLALLFTVPCIVYSQADSLPVEKSHVKTDISRNDFNSTILSFGGIGVGIGSGGVNLCLDYTLILSNSWGGNVSISTNIAKSKNTPSDYFEDGYRTFSPKDYVSIISFNLVKEFATPQKTLRYGFEAGPSWVNYSMAELELNPNYHPDDGSGWWFSTFKYYKTHNATNTIGLSLKAKLEFLSGRHVGFDLALFANINSIRPVIGIESYFHFGKVRD